MPVWEQVLVQVWIREVQVWVLAWKLEAQDEVPAWVRVLMQVWIHEEQVWKLAWKQAWRVLWTGGMPVSRLFLKEIPLKLALNLSHKLG